MGYDIRLKVFTLRLKKFKKKKNNELMWSEVFDLFEGSQEKKFNSLFKAYLEHFDGKFITYKNWPKAMIITELEVSFKSKERIFYGQFEGGPTNQKFTVKKLDNSAKAITIEKNQVTASPFHFIIYLPENSNVGILITQSLGDFTMHDILKLNFQRFIRSLNSDFMVDYNERITKDAIESYKKGNLTSISIRKSGLSQDELDGIFVNKYEDFGKIKIELKVSFLDKMKDKLFINDIREKIFGKDPDIFETETLETIGLDKNAELFANFEYNGKRSLAKIEDGLKLSPTYIVDKTDVPLNSDNHPNSKKMNEYLLAFMKKMKMEIGIK